MSTLYIYNVDTMQVIETADIDSNDTALINDIMSSYDSDTTACTFTPAFGSNGGLVV